MTETLYIQAINQALHEEMERDAEVIVIGLDVARQGGLFGATRKLYDRFGADRVIDTPISEAGFTGAAIGMAMEGMRPVVEIQFADFVTVAFDQLSTVAAKMHFMTRGATHVPLVVRMPYGVNVSGEGYMTGAGPHHSQSPENWFCHVAGLKVVMPSSPADALGLLKSAIRDENPVMFFEQKGLYYTSRAEIPDGEHLVPLGRAQVKRTGSDVTVIATGAMVMQAIAVAEKLDADGISLEIVDPRTLVPLDRETILTSVAKTGRAVITHEAPATAGFGAEISAVIAEHGFADLKAPIRRVCALDMPVPPGSMVRATMPTQGRIEAAVRELL
ncbi:MAG: alpha-ketoacid dehydrogenase subunit beta [Pseudomonadales bacterium]|jgi:pyruvate/2-oxoglutarate/acetoin dehydrogenase E1 component|nr:alpha-ketoacid dehydrogenase subunit beta [Pseudomonadales bacterium]MDP6469701.1 alpha-ketoacid dehydrogenase subunit beta [Pseudomonadales bacterium]MDP6828942.1 alpha-ketoacid dehydrogenase subunit beta [Pseudomonadales bacterium]MDP6972742.1 alpha-ketoacid dehydrogenase subunit beta [Pseudomonadales bacterium]